MAGSGGASGAVAVQAVAVGGRRSCALLATGLKCWGANSFGALGLQDSESRGDDPNEMGDRLPTVDLGNGQVVTNVVPGGDSHTCALVVGGVKCWGDNDFGQLGLGNFIDRGGYPRDMGEALPLVDLGASAQVEQLVLGSNHSCAVLSGGLVKCWGSNANGQLGLADVLLKGGSSGEMGDKLPTVNVGGARVARLAAGSLHTCAVFESGTLKCWGWELAYEDPAVTPDALPPLELGISALDVAAGGLHTCARLNDGTVRCWQVTAHASEQSRILPPVDFGTAATPERLAVGGARGCALLSDGSVRCWPIDAQDGRSKASVIELGARALQMSASGGRRNHHGCALLEQGEVTCWGANSEGQLGLGDKLDRDGASSDTLAAIELGSASPVP